MIERILSIIKSKNLTPSQFADEIGIQRSGISHLISGRNKPSLEFILKIVKRFPDIDPTWLLLGTTKPDQEVLNFEPSVFNEKNSLNESPMEKKSRSIPEVNKIEKTESLVEKIIVLYRDNSFKEYSPK